MTRAAEGGPAGLQGPTPPQGPLPGPFDGCAACDPGKEPLIQHLESEDKSAVHAILLPEEYKLTEGCQLWEGVRLGKFLGAGAQAKVFRLVRDDGSPTGRVIKVNHEDVVSGMLNNNVVWVGMDREWEIGTQLRAALQLPDGTVPGFMKVCDCLVSSGGGGGAKFAGMIMGELHGFEVYKRMQPPEFHNIHYVREMLFQVFSALDRAQSRLGFVHADLGMRNVMEHYPTLWDQLPADEAERYQALLRQPGMYCNADGSRLPLGPACEFKMIDYGLSKFSTKVAAAAAGRRAQEVVEALHDRCASQRCTVFGSESSPTSIEFTPADVTRDAGAAWLLPLHRLLNLPLASAHAKILVRRAAKRAATRAETGMKRTALAAPAAAADVAAATGEAGAPADAAQHSGGGGAPLPARLVSASGVSLRRAVEAADAAGHKKGAESTESADPKKRKRSPIETVYRHWWHRKADVFHLLLTVALVLDNRTWPEHDADTVQNFCSLCHHVTGIKLKAKFKPVADTSAAASAALVVAVTAAGQPTPLGRPPRWTHWWRRWAIRLKGHLFPFNSGLLAREALSHPFFGAGNVRHATVPIPVTNCRWHEEGSGEMLARLPTSATVVAAEPALVHARTA
ncbi:kinase-like superfamily isoform A [Micractinium conductrix]|uniref:Kinase-like superfamily isoform A n=1 Tax=Micractinium conductrix TaxID=554055 RepID=A0A2P6V7V6_9CHLO|nr:kinase-like superfamily isoform A [Micractinium conductrix]|eukprot:PSC70169.1 kinase-like superfamily isoform A [Micractinium conductrix]